MAKATEDPTSQPADRAAPDPDADSIETVSFEWNDQTWTVPVPDEWPFDAGQAIESGRALTFVELVLGPDQMRRFRTGDKTKAKHGAQLMNKIISACGGRTSGE